MTQGKLKDYKMAVVTNEVGRVELEYREDSDFMALDVALYTGREAQVSAQVVQSVHVYRKGLDGDWHCFAAIHLNNKEPVGQSKKESAEVS